MKKGFTLIELLAVIVILAIIALVANPIVLSIISDTKESSYDADWNQCCPEITVHCIDGDIVIPSN